MNEKYRDCDEKTTSQLIAMQLKGFKQDSNQVDDCFAYCKHIRDKVNTAQLATIITSYNQIMAFVSGLKPALIKTYMNDNLEFWSYSWVLHAQVRDLCYLGESISLAILEK